MVLAFLIMSISLFEFLKNVEKNFKIKSRILFLVEAASSTYFEVSLYTLIVELKNFLLFLLLENIKFLAWMFEEC